MKFDLMGAGLPIRRFADLARDAADAGFSGIVATDTGRTAYLSCVAGALATGGEGTGIDVLTGIAVAFPRSPMVTAQVAWELAEATGGRFRLGLGSQVRAHIERRFGMPFDPPGPRLKEYIAAVRACFAAFRGEPLAHDGEYWKLSLLPKGWSPGTIDVPNPPIDISAVNPWMLRMAGQVADGVHVHPLNHRAYLETTVRAEVNAGAAAANRVPGDIELIVPTFAAPGSTPEEEHRWRERARTQVSFYGSTPNYAFIFEQLGRDDITPRIRERQKAGDLAGMAAVVDDDLLEHFCISGEWGHVADRIVERYNGLADRVVAYFAADAWRKDPRALGAWGELARDVMARTAVTPPIS